MMNCRLFIFFFIFIASNIAFSQIEWNPYRENEFETKNTVGARSYVQGSKLVMGTVTLVSGGQAWVVFKNSNKKERMKVRVGDKIFMGSNIVTDSNATVELLLGFNARIRLGSSSILKMKNIRNEEQDKMSLTFRKIILEKGQLRARVKQNTITPSPVIIISVSSEMAVGMPELATMGGVDVFVQKGKTPNSSIMQVLNGSVKMKTKISLIRAASEIVVSKGQERELQPTAGSVVLQKKISEDDIFQIKKRFAFSTESWVKIKNPPTGYNRELDGP